MQVLISAPWWFLLFCLLTGAGYAYLLYRRSPREGIYRFMAILRFVSVSLLSFLLLGPVVVQVLREVQKPRIIMVLDNSESVIAGKDAGYYSGAFLQEWKQASQVLGEEYEVEYIDISGTSSDSFRFDRKKTDLSRFFDYVNNSAARQNTGAVILASDGIYNRGSNPLYKTLNKFTPLYTLGMGDSSLKKDLLIRDLSHNAIAFLNNRFPIEFTLSAFACEGQSTVLKLESEGKTLYTETLRIDKQNWTKTILTDLEADRAGSRHIVASLSPLRGEHSTLNNRRDIFIDVIDGREKVLLAYQGPHPDIGALKEAIQSNRNYEVQAIALHELRMAELASYSVAILHQLPGRGADTRPLIAQLRKLQIPVWSISGSQSAIEQLGMVHPQAQIDRHQGRFNESQAAENPAFQAFTLEPATLQSLSEFPPLRSPYGTYRNFAHSAVLCFQKIGQVETTLPLWCFSEQNGEKTAFLFGEGFWRWRLFDHARNGSHLASNELVGKTIQFLALKEDKRRFRVYPLKKQYDEDEAVRFVAEIYNASYEAVNTAQVTLNLSNAEGKVFRYTFSKQGKTYRLDPGILPPGIYRYVARAEGISESISGKLIVHALQTELVDTRADFGLLRLMAAKNNGTFFPARDLQKALQAVQQNKKISSVSFQEKRPDELINKNWVFLLLLLLLSAEWAMRKYEGAA